MMTLTQLVRGKNAYFMEYHNGNLFYEVEGFRFPVPVEELDGASVRALEKSSIFMKWIKKALDECKDAALSGTDEGSRLSKEGT